MKKISNLGLPLTRQELKNVVGGDDFSGCSVSCNSGYFACCNVGPSCHCLKNGSTDTCQDGGPGSNSCSIEY